MKRIPLTLFWILAATVLCSAQTTVYLPQIVDGGQWTTAIGITNAAATGTASGTFTFTQSNGTAFNVAFADPTGNSANSVGNTLSFSLSGGQSAFFVSTAAEPLTVGFATVTSNLPITIGAVFQETIQPMEGSAVVFSGGVAAASPVTSQAIFVIQLENTSSAVAIANPGNSSASVSFQLLTTAGVAAFPSSSITLAANSQTAQYVAQLFPNISSPFLGTMQITSKTPLVATTLLFSGAGFGTLPVIPVASLVSPSFEWLERRPWLAPLTSIARLLSGLQFRLG